jgi:macrolide transport system ATP-binding/permease protein
MFRRKREQTDFNAEIETHLELETERLKEQGLSEEEARRAARRAFGNVTQAQERFYESGRWLWWDHFVQDTRFSLRLLAKNPGFTAVAVVTLALGIGVNTAIFSVAEAALLRSWPAKAPERLAKIVARTPQGRDDFFSYPDYLDLSEQSKSLEGILAYSRHGMILRVGAQSQIAVDDIVSPDYFTVLGVDAQLGHTFSAEPHASSELTVVVSDSLWRRTFNADPSLVGKQIWLTGKSYTVIGIAPPHFRGLQPGIPSDLWLPVTTEYKADELSDRNNREFELLGRLRPGARPGQARVELGIIGRRLAEAYPAVDKARDVTLVSERERLQNALLPTLLLTTAVGLVLLICCANVSGLVLARSETRSREIAVRLALGAGRLRLVRQLLTESTLLALAGAAVGLVLAAWLFTLQPALMPPAEFELGLDLRLDGSVIAFTAAVSGLAVMVFGLAPAVQASKYSLVPALKGEEPIGGRPVRRFAARNTVVLGEIAISVVLLTASGLLVRSLLYSRGINLGFDKQKNLIFFDLSPGIAGYDAERSLPYFEQVRERVAGLPGVAQVSFARRVLLSDSGGGAELRVAIPGVELPQGQRNIPIKFNGTSLGYFRTMGTRLLEGRDFTTADSPSGAKVVVVSQAMAGRFWPGKDAVGQRIVAEGKDCQVVGVAEDAKINQVHEAAEPYIYFPFAQWPGREATLIVATAGDPRVLVATIRTEIESVDRKVLVRVRTMQYLMQQAFWQDQMTAGFAGTLSMLGMFLASFGLYGVIAYMVNQRRHEIGIRMALGAERRDVLRMVLGQGLRFAAIGTGVGLVASLAAMRLLSNLLYGVRPTDPLAFAGSSALVILVAVAASYFPARRATRVDPMVALRYE